MPRMKARPSIAPIIVRMGLESVEMSSGSLNVQPSIIREKLAAVIIPAAIALETPTQNVFKLEVKTRGKTPKPVLIADIHPK